MNNRLYSEVYKSVELKDFKKLNLLFRLGVDIKLIRTIYSTLQLSMNLHTYVDFVFRVNVFVEQIKSYDT